MTNLRSPIFSSAIAFLTSWRQPPWLKTSLKIIQGLIIAAVIAYLLFRLNTLGWKNIYSSLPRAPWFYLVFACNYMLVPLADTLIYSLVLQQNLIGSLTVFMRKMIYNDVVDYSGEAHLGLWIKQQFTMDIRAALSMLKDINLLSGLAGNLVTLGVVAAFLASGKLALLLKINPHVRLSLILGVGIGTCLVLVMVVLRRQLLGLGMAQTLQVLAVHIGRALAALGLLALQWAVALPTISAATWFIFLTGGAVLGRIPFLPNRNLMFMGLALAMTDLVTVPKTAISGVFLASGALSLAASAIFMVITSVRKPDVPVR